MNDVSAYCGWFGLRSGFVGFRFWFSGRVRRGGCRRSNPNSDGERDTDADTDGGTDGNSYSHTDSNTYADSYSAGGGGCSG
jgi:hypothetical protein